MSLGEYADLQTSLNLFVSVIFGFQDDAICKMIEKAT